MDVQMPVMDGLECAARIRKMPEFRELPILAMTANAMAGDRDRSLAAGMNDHVTKPIEPDELFDALRRWLPERDRATPAADAPPAAGAADPGVGTAANDDDWLHAIADLDAADGLRRVLGNRSAYVALLRRFASSQAGAATDIRTALSDGRTADAERGAHTLKGVAGNIGARELQREAGELEAALRRGDPGALVAPLLDRTAQVLERLLAAIAGSLPPEATVARPLATIDRRRSTTPSAARSAALAGRGRGARCLRRVAATARCRLRRADGGNRPIAERLPVRGGPRGAARRSGGYVKALSESRILIVDDAEANVDVLVNLLRADYRLSVALDGQAALRAVAKNPPDLVLLES